MTSHIARDCIIAALLGFVVTFTLGELYIRVWS